MSGNGVERAVISSGRSVAAVIPADLARLLGIEAGDRVEWTVPGPGELRLRPADEDGA